MVFGGTLKNPVYQELCIEKSDTPHDSPKVRFSEVIKCILHFPAPRFEGVQIKITCPVS